MQRTLFALFAVAAISTAASRSQTFTGVITDAMCVSNHATMHDAPDSKCVLDCAKGTVKYVLFDGKNAYKLSDQETPAKFAAKKVKVTGTLFPKTGVIQVEKIAPLD
jgi:hypothetical protein